MQNKPPPVLPPSVGSTLPLGLISSTQDRASSGCGVMKRRRRKREDPRLQTSPNQRRVLTRCLPRRVEDKGRGEVVPSRVGAESCSWGGSEWGCRGSSAPGLLLTAADPGGRAPPPPHAQHPSCGSKLVPKSDWTQTKDLQISCHGDFHLTGCFSTGVSGTVCGSGVHSRVGVRAAPLPPQAVPPSSCVGIETTTALPRRHRVTQFN